MDSNAPAALDVSKDALSKRVLAKGRIGLRWVQLKSPCHGEQIVVGEPPARCQEQRMCVPELPMHAGQLGELRGQVRSRMERRHGEVAPDEAEAVEAVQE